MITSPLSKFNSVLTTFDDSSIDNLKELTIAAAQGLFDINFENDDTDDSEFSSRKRPRKQSLLSYQSEELTVSYNCIVLIIPY